MYEAHFGLKNRPFGSKAEGAGVFVGPQQAKIMTSLRKGLIAADAIVTVTGPVGVGKTTIVSRALESISPGRMVAWVGRMQFAPDEVLELLLTGFGVSRQAKGTIQRFAAFRRLLNERAVAGAQVAIVVEDAMRIGVDALVELEALTAADTGDASSANIILMGPPELNKLLATPELARIRQRNRLRQTIEQFSATEVNGYLKHCIREAGGDYDAMFEDGVTDIVFRCSEGIPRIINTLSETALSTAAETHSKQISVALMRQVAADAFGFEPDLVDATPSVEAANTGATPAVEQAAPAAKLEPVAETETQAPLPEVVVEPGQYPNVTPVVDVELAAEVTPPVDIPELINDTNPALKQLDAESVAADADTELDIESTQTQKRPAAFASDEPADSEGQEPDFDLDQALSPDTDSTNLMPGLTPNLDQLAAASRRQDLKNARPVRTSDDDAPHEAAENLPTLSDSMRVDVEVEVERAIKADNVQAANSSAMAEPVSKPDIEPEPESDPLPEHASAPISEPEPAAEIASASKPEPEPAAEFESEPEPEPEPAAKIASAPLPKPLPLPEPEPEAEPEAEAKPKAEDVSVPAIASAPISEPEPEAETKTESVEKPATEPDAPVELYLEAESAPETATKPSPPGELRAAGKKAKRNPDIGALEAALDSAKRGDFAARPGNEPIADLKIDTQDTAAAPVQESKDEPLADIPEITLDNELSQNKASDQKLEKCALEIGNANSLEDISDFAAETIFGNEAFDEIAAAVTANPPVEEPSPVLLQDSEITAAANDTIDAKLVADTTPKDPAAIADLDSSAKSRLAMVNALNNGIPTVPMPQGETIEMGGDNSKKAATPPKPKGPQPEPIEYQINTSMTQTLKALSAAKAARPIVEEDEKPAGGLFSRFRRSS